MSQTRSRKGGYKGQQVDINDVSMTVTEAISPQSELVRTLTEFSLNFDKTFESLKVSLAVDIDRAVNDAITKQIDRLREEIRKDIDDLSKHVAGVEKSQQDCAQKQDNFMKSKMTLSTI